MEMKEKPPLGWPKGSVRAVLALETVSVVLMTIVVLTFQEKPVPELLVWILGGVLGAYGLLRTAQQGAGSAGDSGALGNEMLARLEQGYIEKGRGLEKERTHQMLTIRGELETAAARLADAQAANTRAATAQVDTAQAGDSVSGEAPNVWPAPPAPPS